VVGPDLTTWRVAHALGPWADRKFNATRLCRSKGLRGCDAFIKLW
jgi:hypothetical protein